MMYGLPLLIFPLFSIVFSHNIYDEFDSNPYWSESYRFLCEKDRLGNPDLSCYVYRVYLFEVRVEVRSLTPPLIILRGLIPSNLVNDFLHDVSTKELSQQKVVDNIESSTSKVHEGRKANGTYFSHYETPTTKKIFNLIQQQIAAVDFRSAEPLTVLSYSPGGHYAPHFDFLPFANEEQEKKDELTGRLGNRLITFLMILKTADVGGGTVFPRMDSTIQPEVGDAILWFNMHVSYNKDEESLHGACPIYEGNKIAATLWVRRVGHELLIPCRKDGEYDIQALLKPSEKILRQKMNQ